MRYFKCAQVFTLIGKIERVAGESAQQEQGKSGYSCKVVHERELSRKNAVEANKIRPVSAGLTTLQTLQFPVP